MTKMDKKFKVQSTCKYIIFEEILDQVTHKKIFFGVPKYSICTRPYKEYSHAGVLNNQNHLPPVNSVQAS